MDALLQELVKFGIAGVAMAVIVAIAWQLLQRQNVRWDSDIQWHRTELTRQGDRLLEAQTKLVEQHRSAMTEQTREFCEALKSFREVVSTRLEGIDQRLSGYSADPEFRERSRQQNALLAREVARRQRTDP